MFVQISIVDKEYVRFNYDLIDVIANKRCFKKNVNVFLTIYI